MNWSLTPRAWPARSLSRHRAGVKWSRRRRGIRWSPDGGSVARCETVPPIRTPGWPRPTAIEPWSLGWAQFTPITRRPMSDRLWDALAGIRQRWLSEGSLPLYGAGVRITPEGVIELRRGRWRGEIA